MRKAATDRRAVEQVSVREGEVARRTRRDVLATEEPLEIRIVSRGETHRVSVTMRTPGADFELAAGFLFTEALIDNPDQITGIRYCVDSGQEGAQQYNLVNVQLGPDAPFYPAALQRNFYATSSCGICGKASIDAVRGLGCANIVADLRISAATLVRLPDMLRQGQPVFDRTGGLHAAALFTADGTLLRLREDVGRHNALDKLIGAALLKGEIPLRNGVVLASGRLSFELVQKAARAGVPVLAGVSAPSSLAVELAAEVGITLVGFLREERFNVYTRRERIGVEPVNADPALTGDPA